MLMWGPNNRAAAAALCAAAVAVTGCGTDGSTTASPVPATPTAVAGSGPVTFEANGRRTHPGVRFLARGPGQTLFLTSRGATLAAADRRERPLRLALVGARRNVRPSGLDRLAGVVNDYTGNDRRRWRTGIPTFGRVFYPEVWDGIDVEFHGRNDALEYDVIVGPGADPRAVRLRLSGGEGRVRVDRSGRLIVPGRTGRFIQGRPKLYQERAGRRTGVDGRYVLRDGEIRLRVGRYDRSRPLVVDPTIEWSTFNGGTGDDTPRGITTLPDGSVVVTGGTTSTDFPTANPADATAGGSGDAFVTRISADGTTRLYSTYLGGTDGDEAAGVAAITGGAGGTPQVAVVGRTLSADFPTLLASDATYGGNGDGFVTVIGATGALVRSSFLGGDSSDRARGVTSTDGLGRFAVVGDTVSPGFPTTPGVVQPVRTSGEATEAFLTTFTNSGAAIAASTFFGATGSDSAAAVTWDSFRGLLVVAGSTTSADLPGTAGAAQAAAGGQRDAFVAGYSLALTSRRWATYHGGAGDDEAFGVAMRGGIATVVGSTQSADLPTTAADDSSLGGPQDAFLARFDASGGRQAATYLGGDDADVAYGVAAAPGSGRLLVGGADQAGGDVDATLWRFSPDGQDLLDRTALTDPGASGDAVLGVTATADGKPVVTGLTDGAAFPTTAGVVQPVKSAGNDAFVARLDNPGATDTSPPTTTLVSGPSSPARGTSHRFTFTSSEPGSTFACQIDGVVTSPCSSPFDAVVGTTGAHSAIIVAVDPAGNQDPVGIQFNWNVTTLTPLPQTTILTGPSGTVTDPDQSFTFAADPTEAGLTFECELAPIAAYQTCSSPRSFTDLAPGTYTFGVRVRDADGIVDATPATRTFTVGPGPDATPPQTTITSGPQGPVRGAAQSFGLASDEPGSTFTCEVVPDAVPAPCTSPFVAQGLTVGPKTLRVTATDPSGNVDPTPAERMFSVYATAQTLPDTVITSGPSGTVAPEGQVFTFAAEPTEPGVTFECALNSEPLTPCTSPKALPLLAPGEHTFRVRLRDAGDVTDPSPAERTFQVGPPPTGPDAPVITTPPARPAPPAFDPPVAALATVTNAQSGRPIVLDATRSTGEGLRFAFDRDGDGRFETDTASSPTAVATAPATGESLAVAVRVTDAAGRSSIARTTVEVPVPPALGLVASSNRIPVGGRVTFRARTATATAPRRARPRAVAPSGSAYYAFAFGDGAIAAGTGRIDDQWTIPGTQTSPVTTHRYSRAGSYDYDVISTLPGSAVVRTTGSIKVATATDTWTGGVVEVQTTGGPVPSGIVGQPFVATAVAEGEIPIPGFKDPFSGKQQSSSGIVKNGRVRWDWGDGTSTDTADEPDHDAVKVYANPGTYTVRMTYVSTKGEGTRIITLKNVVRDQLCSNRTKPFAGDLTFTADGPSCLDPAAVDGQWITAPGGAVRVNQHLVLRHATGGRLLVSPDTGAVGVAPGQSGALTATMAGVPLLPPAAGLKGITVDASKRGYRVIPQLTHTTEGKGYSNLRIVKQTVNVAKGGAGAVHSVVFPEPFVNAITKTLGNANGLAEGTKDAPKATGAQAAGDFAFNLDGEQFGPVEVDAELRRTNGRLTGGGAISAIGLNFDAPFLEEGQVISKTNPPRDLSGPSGFAIRADGTFEHAGFALLSDPPINVFGAFGLSKIGAKVSLDPLFFQGKVAGQVPATNKIASFDVCVQLEQLKAGEKTRFCADEFLNQFKPETCVQDVVKVFEANARATDPKVFYPRSPFDPRFPDPAATADDPERLADFRASTTLFAKTYVCTGIVTSEIDQFWLTVRGTVDLFGFGINSRFSYRDAANINQTIVDFRAGFDEKFGPLRVRAGVGGTIMIEPEYRWQFTADARISLGSLFEAEGAVLVNKTWLAGCGKLGPLQVSGGFNWKTRDFSWPDEKFGCLSNIKYFFGESFGTTASASALGLRAVGPPLGRAAVNGVTLDGSRDQQLLIRGTTGIPRVELTGPDGTKIVTGGIAGSGPGWRSEIFPEINMIQIGLAKPAKGAWKVTTAPGSPTIARVAGGGPQARSPIVRTRVVKRDGRMVLRYMVEARKGRVVTFYEVSRNGTRTPIGNAKGKAGGLRFQPALGRPGTRRIVATVEENGFPRPEMVVGSYVAPRTPKIGRPAGVRATRSAGRLLVRWAPVGNARSYEVRVLSGRGPAQRVEVKAGKARLARFIGVPATADARVEVRGLAPAGRRSAPTTVRVRRSVSSPGRLRAAGPVTARRPSSRRGA